jgi:hypothetical protein
MHNEHHMLLQHHHYVGQHSPLSHGTIQLKQICEYICIVHLKPFKTYTMQTIKLKFPQFQKCKIQQLTMKHMQIAQLLKNHKSQVPFCKPLFSIP